MKMRLATLKLDRILKRYASWKFSFEKNGADFQTPCSYLKLFFTEQQTLYCPIVKKSHDIMIFTGKSSQNSYAWSSFERTRGNCFFNGLKMQIIECKLISLRDYLKLDAKLRLFKLERFLRGLIQKPFLWDIRPCRCQLWLMRAHSA